MRDCQIIHKAQHLLRHHANDINYKNAGIGENIKTVGQALDALQELIVDIDVTQLEQDIIDLQNDFNNLTASEVALVPAGNLSSTDVQAGMEELQGDVDTINDFLNGLTAAVVLKGSWSAGIGTFPGSGLAKAGWTYIVGTGGTVDGVTFNVNDRIMAIVDDASETTFADNWFKLDYTDQVLSVNGQTGAAVLDADDISDAATTNKWSTAGEKTKLGHITVTQAVDLDTIESDTATNNAKVSNATHTGEVTGSGALTLDKTAVSNKTTASIALGDALLFGDASDAGNLKKTTAQDLVDLAILEAGLGTIASQDANNVAITGGTLSSVVISGTLGGDIDGDGYFFNGLGGISGIGEIRMNDNGIISTGVNNGDVYYLAAHDVDGAVDVVFVTFSASNNPTCDFSTAVTIGGQYIYRVGGTDVSLADGGTGASMVENGVDNFVRLGAGETGFTLVEIDSNYANSSPTFTNVSTTTINSLTAPTGGLYTPTYTNVANVASFGTVSDLSWYRIGNWVTLFGRVSINPTSASINTEFRFTIPVASNFTLFTDVGGSAVCVTSVSLCAGARADTTNDQITIKYINTAETGAQDFSLHVSYRVH